MELPEKINFGDTLSLYEGRKPEPKKLPDIEELNFDKAAVQSKMNEIAQKVLSSYRAVGRDSEGTILDRPDVWKKLVPIEAKVIDEAIPLTFYIMKSFFREGDKGEESVRISFNLVKGKLESDNQKDLFEQWRSNIREGNLISTMEFIDNGTLFDCKDRMTDAKFRKQGFGSMILKASEGFMQASATDKQEVVTVFADAAQIDVICWLYNKGYRPQTDEDAKRLNEVLAGDNSIVIGENNYIFKNVPEESRIKRLSDGRTIPDRHNAYRIKFVKEIQPQQGSSISDIQSETQKLIDKVKIDYGFIADAYGYKPVPEGFQPIPAVDISIDWQSGAEQRQAQQRAAMRNFDTVPLSQSAENARRQEGLIDEVIIPTDKGGIHLTTEKWRYPNDDDFLRLHLTDQQTGQEISQFISARNGNVWDMHDRVTSESYRSKGVASQMIDATENCVQAVANAKGEDQKIVMETAQLPVLSVFLNKGYNVLDEDKKRFAEVMSKLKAGDRKYILASCEADFQGEYEERKTWYVFERETYERMGDEIWKVDPIDQKANYMKHSLRFKLRKKIEAKSDDIAGEFQV